MPSDLNASLVPNRQIIAQNAPTALTYDLRTIPDPLTVSLPDSLPTNSGLELVITNESEEDIKVVQIELTLRFGTKAASLAATSEGIRTSVSADDIFAISPPPKTEDGEGTYTIGPVTGEDVVLKSRTSVVVELTRIAVNTQVGTTTVSIDETINEGGGDVRASTDFSVTKFPYGFFFDGLVATLKQGSELVPVAQVRLGETVTLIWNGSVVIPSNYSVLYSSNDGPKIGMVTTLGQWISPPLDSPTEFVVQVKVNFPGGLAFTRALSTGVSVVRPNAMLNELKVYGALVGEKDFNAKGAVTLNKATVIDGVVAADSVVATGKISASGLTASSVTSNGPLEVKGTATIAAATIPGALCVKGHATIASATIIGPLTATGEVSIFGQIQNLGSSTGSYLAPTDGIMVAHIGASKDGSKRSVVYVGIHDANVGVEATGGNVSYPYGIYDYKSVSPQSCAMPIPKGTNFRTFLINAASNEINPEVSFFWVPIGSGRISVLQEVAESVPAPPSIQLAALQAAVPQEPRSKDPQIERLVGVIGKLAGNASSELLQEVRDALRSLVYE